MYYTVDYKTKCEVCGREYSGQAKNLVRDGRDSGPLSDLLYSTKGVDSLLDHAEARLAKNRLENNVIVPPYDDIEFTNVECPFCGARQSWRPLLEPKEPAKPSGPIGMMIICAIFLGIVGMLAGLFIMVFTNSSLAIVIPALVGVVLGCVIGKVAHNSQKAEDKELYEKSLARYPQLVEEYNAFMKDLESRKELHKPEADLSTGRFTES